MNIHLEDYYKKKNNATFSQRLIAYLIDYTICGGILALLDLSYFSIFVIPAYFIISQVYYNRTYGKHMVGLRTISKNKDKHVFNIILRETVGKCISTLLLGLGYLKILFGERTALHDDISETRVISLKQVNSNSNFVFLKTTATLGTLLIVAVFSLYYSFLYTALPVHLSKNFLLEKGVTFQSASGDSQRGYVLNGFSYRSYDRGISLDAESAIINFNFKDYILKSKNKKETYIDKFSLKDISIHKINYENFNLNQEIYLHEFTLKNLLVNKTKGLTIFDYNIVADNKGFLGKYLEKDLAINGYVKKLDEESNPIAQLSAFDNKFNLKLNNGFDIKIKNLTLSEHIKTDFPISQITLRGGFSGKGLTIKDSGGFKLRNRSFSNFSIRNRYLTAASKDKSTRLTLNPYVMFYDTQWLEISKRKDRNSSLKDQLSKLYLNKPYNKVTNDRNKKLIAKDYRYFTTGPFKKYKKAILKASAKGFNLNAASKRTISSQKEFSNKDE